MIQLGIPMLTFLLVFIILDNYIKWVIPDRKWRKRFKHQNEFYITLAYLFAPLFMLQSELIYLNSATITFDELDIFIILFMVKVVLFILAAQNLETLIRNLKTFKIA